MSEISDRYRRLSAQFADTIAAVPAEKWSAPSPCEDWTAVEIVQHVVDTRSLFRSFIGLDPTGAPPAADDPLAAFTTATAVMQADLDDPAIATTSFQGFAGETTYEQAVDRFANVDLVVHRWDVAHATGVDETIDPEDVEYVRGVVEGFGDMLRGPGVCGPEVPVPDDADDQTRLLAFLGRRA
jgi:uncharacterized protein (TIGR03086 family)